MVKLVLARPTSADGAQEDTAEPERQPRLTNRFGRPAKVALVHDWFAEYYGSERVVEHMLRCFPDADLFSLVDVMSDEQRRFLRDRSVTTSFIQRLPYARPHFRGYFPLMPLAVEQFDLSGYDLVLSSSHAFAKGVLTGPDQLHVSYVHTPIRYGWECQHEYLRYSRMDKGLRGLAARYALHRLRMWDVRTANGVDHFVANSRFIQRRIDKTYRRSATVIYPPVEVESFPFRREKEDFYLLVSRFVPYKRVDLVVDAFTVMKDKRLVVIGRGSGEKAIQRRASSNVTFLGYQSARALRDHMSRARGLVFAAEEDFGIVPVEAQACGTPVVAYGGGGALETVRDVGCADRPTGIFFDEQSVPAIVEAIRRFEREGGAITPEACRANALRFTPDRFQREFHAYVGQHWAAHNQARLPTAQALPARGLLAPA